MAVDFCALEANLFVPAPKEPSRPAQENEALKAKLARVNYERFYGRLGVVCFSH